MRVYLVRHGIALPADGGTPDEHRSLSADGRRLFRESAQLWSEQGGSPTRWLVSPLVRAVQTCEIALGAFGSEGPVEVSTDLLPEARVSAAAQRRFARHPHRRFATCSKSMAAMRSP